jgi:hypothetical protein
MAVYRVNVMSCDGAVVIDHADTVEMGGGYHTDEGSRSLAQSYARTGVIQAVQQGYPDPYATIVGPYGEISRITAADVEVTR